MSTFPGSPKVLKGAIVGVNVLNPLASVVVFQYNPDTLTRTLRARPPAASGDKSEALRLVGPPDETITLDVEIDAADQLERRRRGRRAARHLPRALARSSCCSTRSRRSSIANEVLTPLGMIEVIPPEAPLTLFVWGLEARPAGAPHRASRITEEAFDPSLNPIRAKVSLGLDVLNYDDLGLLSVGGALFLAHQIVKEVMATIDGGTPATPVRGRASSTLGDADDVRADQPLRDRRDRDARACSTPTGNARAIALQAPPLRPAGRPGRRRSSSTASRRASGSTRHRALRRRPDAVLALCDANEVLRPERARGEIGRVDHDRDAAAARREC